MDLTQLLLRVNSVTGLVGLLDAVTWAAPRDVDSAADARASRGWLQLLCDAG
jgi:hypothetical protein